MEVNFDLGRHAGARLLRLLGGRFLWCWLFSRHVFREHLQILEHERLALRSIGYIEINRLLQELKTRTTHKVMGISSILPFTTSSAPIQSNYPA
jgi:hypothetical protein